MTSRSLGTDVGIRTLEDGTYRLYVDGKEVAPETRVTMPAGIVVELASQAANAAGKLGMMVALKVALDVAGGRPLTIVEEPLP